MIILSVITLHLVISSDYVSVFSIAPLHPKQSSKTLVWWLVVALLSLAAVTIAYRPTPFPLLLVVLVISHKGRGKRRIIDHPQALAALLLLVVVTITYRPTPFPPSLVVLVISHKGREKRRIIDHPQTPPHTINHEWRKRWNSLCTLTVDHKREKKGGKIAGKVYDSWINRNVSR